MSHEGERRSAEEESRTIWHERFIRFTKGDYSLKFKFFTRLDIFFCPFGVLNLPFFFQIEEDEKLKKRKERFGGSVVAGSVGSAEVEVGFSPFFKFLLLFNVFGYILSQCSELNIKGQEGLKGERLCFNLDVFFLFFLQAKKMKRAERFGKV